MTSQLLTTVHRKYMMRWLMLLSMSASMRGTFSRLVEGLLVFSFVWCAFFCRIPCNAPSKMTLIFPNKSLRKLWHLKLRRMKMERQSPASSKVFSLNVMQIWSYLQVLEHCHLRMSVLCGRDAISEFCVLCCKWPRGCCALLVWALTLLVHMIQMTQISGS